jgi:lambda family phage portal protein
MIANLIDRAVSVINPQAGLRRAIARRTLERAYQGAESNRITANKKPKNQSADQEMLGPFGADAARAWARAMVRDNAYARGVVDTIVASVVGCGIQAQSVYETPEGADLEGINDTRDAIWQQWSEVCDFNGLLSFEEIQQLALREMVEAGEVLIRIVRTPSKTHKGITRPIPLALELIEADRIALDRDQYLAKTASRNRIIRGIEVDEFGKPLNYFIYPEHPNSPYATIRESQKIPANEILHLFRRERIGQTRGVTWFAPAMQWIRDLGVYVDNELQSSAVAACFAAAITTETPLGGLADPAGGDSVDEAGNSLDYVQPGAIFRLAPGEKVEQINPARPNSNAAPWIELILRGIAVGTGLSYEVVARDYSKTSYSSSRTSQLEDRRRFRCWQTYLRMHLCQPVWDAFCNSAAAEGVEGFPTAVELLDNRRMVSPVEWQMPDWEWVDPSVEQSTAQASIDSFMSDYRTELGARGKNWKAVFYQRKKEEELRKSLGLSTPAEQQLEMVALNQTGQEPPAAGSGEMQSIGKRNADNVRKLITNVLGDLVSGAISEARAKAELSMLGVSEANAAALIEDAKDGTIDTPTEELASAV